MMQAAPSTTPVSTSIQPTVETPMVRRLVPTYQTRVAAGLGITEICLGAILIVISIVVFAIKAFTSTGGGCLLAGIGMIACGIFGILSSKKKEIWTITGHQFLAILSLVFAVVILAAGATGIPHENERIAPTSVEVRKAVDIVAIVLAVISCAVLVWSVVLGSSALYYGCCKQTSGAKYVPDSNVKFNSAAADPGLERAAAEGESSMAATSSKVSQDPAVLSVT